MGFVKLEKQGHVGIVTIDRQEALNALNSQVLSDLDAVIDQVAADDEIYVMILTGAGRSFVAGADIGEMKGFSSIDGKKFGVHGVPQAGEPVQARDCGGKRLRPGRRL